MAKNDLIERMREKCPYCDPCTETKREAADHIEELERGRTSFEERIDYLERVVRESGHVVGYHPHGTEKESEDRG